MAAARQLTGKLLGIVASGLTYRSGCLELLDSAGCSHVAPPEEHQPPALRSSTAAVVALAMCWLSAKVVGLPP